MIIFPLKDWLYLFNFLDSEETENNDCPVPEVISVSSSPSKEVISVTSSPSKDNEAVNEDVPIAGPSGVTSDSSANERKPITWNESP